jgi:hypothetical protein
VAVDRPPLTVGESRGRAPPKYRYSRRPEQESSARERIAGDVLDISASPVGVPDRSLRRHSRPWCPFDVPPDHFDQSSIRGAGRDATEPDDESVTDPVTGRA